MANIDISSPDDRAISQQPSSQTQLFGADGAPGSTPVNGVSVRNLVDTPADAAFAAAMLADSFRGKLVHNVGERGLPILVKNMEVNHSKQPARFYERIFVAEHDGRQAGVMQLRFNGDFADDSDDYISELGCWATCRIACLDYALDEEVDKGRCYLDHIAVDSGHRGKGIGKVMLDRADWEARRANCTVMLSYVSRHDKNGLIEFATNVYPDQPAHPCSLSRDEKRRLIRDCIVRG